MNEYFTEIARELEAWSAKIEKGEGVLSRFSKGAQAQMRKLMPQKIQDAITAAMKQFISAVMYGSGYVSDFPDSSLSLAESDYVASKRFSAYKKAALGEGAAAGAGGFVGGLADLPALLGIKIKFLFDCASVYGYDTSDPRERVFMLLIFQLAFSGHDHRLKAYRAIKDWDMDSQVNIDWEKLQVEYRDYLDIAKLVQLVPVIGAPVGAIANWTLMEQLKENAVNSYRMRRLKESGKKNRI
ncbi:MAG: EcsC family protein [Clostridiales bacterium]|nr:EcsC family protein [Clostridiales bacterium]